ncbi:MAG: ABC transporter permease [Oligoflexia bacterium]|nr:ABC transporter permease [Oligoflexia bacterium]
MASTRPDSGRSAFGFLWSSGWTGWVGFRYLKSKKNSRFLSFITSMSIIGVGLGVTSMIVVLSVMDGFEAELKKRLMASDVHILITPTAQLSDFDAGFVPSRVIDEPMVAAQSGHAKEIDQFYPVISTEAILRIRKQVAGVVLKGVPDERLARVRKQAHESVDLPSRLDDAHLAGVYIGQELAYELGLTVGETVTLISPTETEGPDSAVPRLKRYLIEGVYESGIPEQELHEVFTTPQAVQSFLRRSGVATRWEMTVKDFDRAPAIAADLRKQLPEFKVQDWIDLNSHLFHSLRLERASMSIILAFIVIVASFNIVTTLTLMVLEKKKEISILKAMGARDGEVAAIFIAEGLLIGGVGILGGIGFGFSICELLRHYPIIQLPDVFYDRTLPVTFDPVYYVGVGVCAVLIVLGACLYPSRRAARLEPIDGIRFG